VGKVSVAQRHGSLADIEGFFFFKYGLFCGHVEAQIVTLLLGAGLFCRKIGFFGRDMALLHKYRVLLWRYRVANRDATPWGRSFLMRGGALWQK